MTNTFDTHGEVQIRAYEFWQSRGEPWGTPETDWFRAENELTGEKSSLVELAREVGGALGAVVGLVTERMREQH